MINFETEKLISLKSACELIPEKPSIFAIYKWTTRGRRGIILESIQIGGTRFTSHEAIDRFYYKLTKASDNLKDEKIISLEEALNFVPKKVSKSTLYRWMKKGSEGVILESTQIARIKYTSREALSRFFQKLAKSTVDFGNEKLISLKDILEFIFTRPSIPTLYNWTTKGCRGVVLESIDILGTRYTTFEAINRFFQKMTKSEIDFKNEKLVSLKDACELILRDEKPSKTSIYRWATKGYKGIFLESVEIGLVRYTTYEAINKFNQEAGFGMYQNMNKMI